MSPEVIRKSFVRWGRTTYEESDFRIREPGVAAETWSAYCFFKPGTAAARIAEHLSMIGGREFYVEAVACPNAAGTWVIGKRWQLEKATAML